MLLHFELSIIVVLNQQAIKKNIHVKKMKQIILRLIHHLWVLQHMEVVLLVIMEQINT